MTYQRRINPVQRSLSRPLTILGAERKLFFFAMCLGAATFNLLGSLMGGLLIFLLLYFVAVGDGHRPANFAASHSRCKISNQYDPAKWTPVLGLG